MRNKPSTKFNRDGVSAVEFAMVAPVFLLVVFTCIEFTRLSMIKNMVQEAAYYAARDAMVPGATAEECEAAAHRILGRLGNKSATVLINNGQGIDDLSDEVSVTVSVPLSESTLFFPFPVGDMTLSSTAIMQTERYSGPGSQ